MKLVRVKGKPRQGGPVAGVGMSHRSFLTPGEVLTSLWRISTMRE
jgi:hypothetical protein